MGQKVSKKCSKSAHFWNPQVLTSIPHMGSSSEMTSQPSIWYIIHPYGCAIHPQHAYWVLNTSSSHPQDTIQPVRTPNRVLHGYFRAKTAKIDRFWPKIDENRPKMGQNHVNRPILTQNRRKSTTFNHPEWTDLPYSGKADHIDMVASNLLV